MGWTLWRSPAARSPEPDCWVTGDPESPTYLVEYWCPSTDIACALKVVEKLVTPPARGQRSHYELDFSTDRGCWHVSLNRFDVEQHEPDGPCQTQKLLRINNAPTLPFGICLAALHTLSPQEPQ